MMMERKNFSGCEAHISENWESDSDFEGEEEIKFVIFEAKTSPSASRPEQAQLAG